MLSSGFGQQVALPGRLACTRGIQVRSRPLWWTLSTPSCTLPIRCPTLCVLCRVCSDAACLSSECSPPFFLPSRRRGDGPRASLGRLSRALEFVALARRTRYLTVVGVCYPIMSSCRGKNKYVLWPVTLQSDSGDHGRLTAVQHIQAFTFLLVKGTLKITVGCPPCTRACGQKSPCVDINDNILGKWFCGCSS